MPRIPDSTALGERTVARRRAPIYEDRSGEIAANSLGRAADQLGQIGTQLGEREDKFRYAQAKSSLLTADMAVRKELENDPDWERTEPLPR